jgi:hypothetical protein
MNKPDDIKFCNFYKHIKETWKNTRDKKQGGLLRQDSKEDPYHSPKSDILFFFFYYSYVHTRLGSFLPPTPTPSLFPPPPQYPAETILPLFLILLKREYKQ